MKVAYEFPRLIKQMRKEQEISQSQLSELTGIGQHMISDYERALHVPSLEIADKLFRGLGYKLVVEKI